MVVLLVVAAAAPVAVPEVVPRSLLSLTDTRVSLLPTVRKITF